MKPDKDLDGDLAMELVEISVGNQSAAQEAVRLIREMIQREVDALSVNASRQGGTNDKP